MNPVTQLRRVALLASVIVLAACGGGGDPSTPDGEGDANAALATAMQDASVSKKARAKDGKSDLIVKFHDNVDDPEGRGSEAAAAHGGQLRYSYTHAIKGFAVSLPEAAVPAFMAAMQRNAQVDYVEEDGETTGTDVIQANATWGLDRIDQRTLPLSTSYLYGTHGLGVRVYVVDSGIRASHSELAGRVVPGYGAVNDGYGTNDCNGHGTHVAGTIGGRIWGVAKRVTLVPVRVLGCQNSGSVSGLIAGIDWMVANVQRPAVANLSIGAGASSTLDAAVERAVSAGITMAVAAGNSNANACNYSPARAAGALTVGATGSTDWRASYSNYGACVDLFAPGSNITSAGHASDTASAVMSGTSMATPHVAATAALWMTWNPGATPAQVAAAMKAYATRSAVLGPGTGSPNLLLFTRIGSMPGAPPPAPTVSISVAALSGGAINSILYWHATATIAAKNSSGAMVPGVVVTGSFSPGGGTLSCTTSASGACTITSGLLDMSLAQTTFGVTGMAASSATYSPSSNQASAVTIARP